MKMGSLDAEFAPAPIGLRVRLVTTLVIVATVIVGALALATALTSVGPQKMTPALVAPGIALACVLIAVFGRRIRRYRVEGDELIIEQRWRSRRFPLGGLASADFDREALKGARKVRGNDGLGAMTGHYRSKRLGRFQVCGTNGQNAVVLRWSDGRQLVVTPDDTFMFPETVRAHAGLKGKDGLGER